MWNDLRFALKTLRRSPGFTVVAVLSLALGIGANTAIFSLLFQVVLRSLPVPDAASLVLIESDKNDFGYQRADNNRSVFSYPLYKDLRDRNQALAGLTARAAFPVTLAYHGTASGALAEAVSGNFFGVLGVRPALGRLLLPSDDGVERQNPVIVLSHSYWTAHLGGDPAVLNTRILLNAQPVLIVGVAPRGFRGLNAGQTPDCFAALSMTKLLAPSWQRTEEVDSHWLNLFGRLKPGYGQQRASAMLQPLFRAILQSELPQMHDVNDDERKKILARPLFLRPAAQGLNGLRERWQTPLVVLTVMVGLVLLIACGNVANLLIARATARRREIALRLAIGATAWQLTRQLLVESLVLATAAGLLGLALSGGLTRGLLSRLLSLLPADTAGGWLQAQLDWRLLGYSLALSLLTGLLFGLIPALQSANADVAPALKEQSGGMSAAGSQSRVRQALVVAQICLSLLLTIGAGLFTRSLLNLLHDDPGFQPGRLITFSIDPSLSGYTQARSRILFRELQDKLGGLAGARLAARATLPPFGGFGWGSGLKAPGARNASEEYVPCGQNAVGPGYFRTLGIPLLAGREFTAQDDEKGSKRAILNQTLAHFLYGSDNPIGRHIITGANDADMEIVAVVKDSKYGSVREKADRFLYTPYEQGGDEFLRQSAFFVRTQIDEQQMMAAIRNAVRQIDPNLPLDRLTSVKTMIDDSLYTDRLVATLAIAFGMLAAVLAAVGIYGTISYSVTRRTREFGIRLALGAVPASLLRFVMREVSAFVAIGIGLGLPISYLLARFVESQFFGIHAHDPWVIATAALLIAIIASLAGLVPALRATRIDSVTALRHE
ncbi:MAG: ABC transporter permease [Bryobacteraceae bacterium]